jgi:alpha-glucosidase
VYHYSADPQTHRESFAHLVGPDLLVAPVITSGAREREVYLPRGTDWCDWHTGTVYAGGQTVRLDAPLDARVPLLVRRGSLIPLAAPRRNTGEADTVREVWAFPLESGESRFTLTEDDGETLAYQHGIQTEVELAALSKADGVTFTARARGAYPLPYTHITFVTPRDGRRVTLPVAHE